LIWNMIFKPKSKHVIVELWLFFLERSAIMIFAIIISKSEKYRS
jgi:hypothetical protein